MMPGSTCPYCNSMLPQDAGRFCPRCGEALPGASAIPATKPDTPSRMTNGQVALIILGIMIGMGLLSYSFAMHTVGVREEHRRHMPDTSFKGFPFYVFIVAKLWILGLVVVLSRMHWSSERFNRVMRYTLMGVAAVLLVSMGFDVRRGMNAIREEPRPAPVVVQPTAPADLKGLDYVPADANMILAVHLAEGLQQPTSRDLLSQLKLQSLDLDAIDQMTGIKKEDIDHFIIESKWERRLLMPRFLLILRLLRPLPMDEVRKKLSFHKMEDKSGLELYRIKLETSGKEVFFYFFNDRTVMVCESKSDLVDAVQQPTGVSKLSAPLQTMIKERLPRVAQAWLVGHCDHWNQTTAGAFVLSYLDKSRRTAVDPLQSFGVWLEFGNTITVGAAGRCRSKKGAEKLAELLSEKDLLKFETLKVVQDEDWVSAQAKASKDEAETFLRFIRVIKEKEE